MSILAFYCIYKEKSTGISKLELKVEFLKWNLKFQNVLLVGMETENTILNLGRNKLYNEYTKNNNKLHLLYLKT